MTVRWRANNTHTKVLVYFDLIYVFAFIISSITGCVLHILFMLQITNTYCLSFHLISVQATQYGISRLFQCSRMPS